MRDTTDILGILPQMLTALKGQCNSQQVASLKQMMEDVANDAGRASINSYQQRLIDATLQEIQQPQTATKGMLK